MDMDFGEWMDWITEVDTVELEQWVEWCEWCTNTDLQHKHYNSNTNWTITTQAEQ
jgi:hypothetical protein